MESRDGWSGMVAILWQRRRERCTTEHGWQTGIEWHGAVAVRYKHQLREVMVQRMRRHPRSLRKLDLVRSEPKPTG